MGAKKKKADGENNNDGGKKDDNNNAVILKVDMHCDGCSSRIIRYIRSFHGVETVKVESETGKLTVTGKVDPTKLRDNLAEKIKKKVELISPQPKKEKKDTEPNNKSEKKTDDKKPKDKEAVTTAVLKVALHCQGCLDRIGKTVLKTKGVHEMAIDEEKETVTVKGTMDVKALAGNLTTKLRRKVEVVPPKNDKEGGGKKKNKGGGGGGGGGEGGDDNNEKGDEEGEGKMEQSSYGYGFGNIGGYNYNYGPVYPEQLHFHVYAQPPPQMFSDENPNACFVM